MCGTLRQGAKCRLQALDRNSYLAILKHNPLKLALGYFPLNCRAIDVVSASGFGNGNMVLGHGVRLCLGVTIMPFWYCFWQVGCGRCGSRMRRRAACRIFPRMCRMCGTLRQLF